MPAKVPSTSDGVYSRENKEGRDTKSAHMFGFWDLMLTTHFPRFGHAVDVLEQQQGFLEPGAPQSRSIAVQYRLLCSKTKLPPITELLARWAWGSADLPLDRQGGTHFSPGSAAESDLLATEASHVKISD
ncbi:hypothetical protein D9611_000035 [Ephemerocybe angulata]|uniref:Uncharacterized protein n=1 Tax=Ephemerocybe angulata TaxID=980116 RepID=A0A8H5F7P9_9AGAR|nr:hypothetical protein D9611_000035 [Tulosesus angulatus]